MAYVGADWPDGDASTFGPAGPYETTSQLAPSGVGSTHSPTPPTVLMPATLIALTTTTATPNINDVANFAAASSATPASVASSEHLTTLHPSGPATGSPWPPAFVESANLAAGGVVPAASSWGGAMAPTTMPSSLLHAANSTGGAMANVGQTPMLIFTTTTTTSAPTTSASMSEHTAACSSNNPHHLSPLAAAAAANNTNSNCNRGPGTPPLTLTSPSLVGGHVHTEAMWQARGSPPLIFVPFELTAALSTSSSINLLASGGPSTQLDSPAAPLPADDAVVCGSHPHLPSAAHGRTSTSISTNSLRSEMNTATTTSQQQRCRNSNGGPSASTPLAQASSSSALGITPFTMQILSNSARLLSPPTLMVWPDNGGSCGELPPSSSSRHIDPLQPTHDATSTSSPNLVQHTFIIPAAATLARAATTPPSSPRPPILGPTQTCVPCTELSAVDARLEQCSICLRRHFHHQHHRRRTRVPSAAITSALGATTTTTTTTSDIIHNSTQSQSLSSSSGSSSIASSADDDDEDELMDGSEDAEEVHARTRAELPSSSLLARRRRETAYLPRSASAPLSTEEVKRLRHRGRRMVRLVCRHCFHVACIQRWLLREKRCPLCRFDLSQGSTTASTCSRLANGLS